MDFITISEANKSKFAIGQEIFMSPEAWGDTYFGTREEWEALIPLQDAAARSSIFYDWFSEDLGFIASPLDEVLHWTQYRDALLGELIPVTIA